MNDDPVFPSELARFFQPHIVPVGRFDFFGVVQRKEINGGMISGIGNDMVCLIVMNPAVDPVFGKKANNELISSEAQSWECLTRDGDFAVGEIEKFLDEDLRDRVALASRRPPH